MNISLIIREIFILTMNIYCIHYYLQCDSIALLSISEWFAIYVRSRNIHSLMENPFINKFINRNLWVDGLWMDPMWTKSARKRIWISVGYVFVAVWSGFGKRWGTDYFDKARCIARSLDMNTMTIISRCRNRATV